MPGFTNDLRHAVRRLAAQPAYALTAILTLSAAAGANVLMLDLLDRLLVRPPAQVSSPERVVRFYFRTVESYSTLTSHPDFEDFARGLDQHVESVASYMRETLTLGRGASAQQLQAVSHSSGYFDVLGLAPARGTLPGAGHDTPPNAAVISHALWTQHFGRDDDVIGKALPLGTDTFTIVGVAPRGFAGIDTDAVDVWLPIEVRGPFSYGPEWRSSRGAFAEQVIARLKAGVAHAVVSDAATALYRAANQESWKADTKVVAGDLVLARGPGRPQEVSVALWVAAVSLLVLLIGCGNVAGLMLVSSSARAHEVSVKLALGASRRRVVREVFAEAVLFALLASGGAALVTVTCGAAVGRLILEDVAIAQAPVSWRLLAIAAAVGFAVALVLGTLAALRTSGDPLALQGRLAAQGTHGRSWFLDVFAGAQVALSIPLLVGTALFVSSFQQARSQTFGMEMERVTVVTTNLFEFGEPMRNHAEHRRLQQHLARLPQVTGAALFEGVPMRSLHSRVLRLDDREMPPGAMPQVNGVDPSYFDVMRIRTTAGRLLREDDNRPGARPVAVVNDWMAQQIWPGESPMGRCLGMNGEDCVEVVGVVADSHVRPGRVAPACFVPIERFSNWSSDRSVVVGTAGPAYRSLDLLRREVRAIGNDLPYVDVWALDEVLEPMLRPWRLGASMFLAFATLALLTAGVGLATVVSYTVTRRHRELGIRLALGGRPAQMVQLVVARTSATIVAGVVAGLAGAYVASASVRALLFGIEPSDPRAYIAAGLTMAVVALIAAWLPARRAAKVDPSALLRAE